MGLGIEGVKRLSQFVYGIAPPLRPFTLGTIEVVVAHVHVQRTGCTLPEFVHKRVVTCECSGKFGIVARFAELHGFDLHALGNRIFDDMAAHPPETFVLLVAGACDVFGTYRRGTAVAGIVVVRLDADRVAAGCGNYFQPRGDLCVVG